MGLRPFERRPSELRPWDHSETLYAINLFKPPTPGTFRRPHAFSTGYADRFCGDSSRSPFGGTVDNRSGEEGLPEAVALRGTVEPVDPSTPEYAALRDQLAGIAPWVSSTGPGRIEAVLRWADIHATDLEYRSLQAEILKRLKEKRAFCERYASGSDRCACPRR